MSTAEGARTFRVAGDAYDRFMGRYSRPLARLFADAADVRPGQRALDVGCGPGALTSELVARLGADAVASVDPSEPFVTACAERHPGVDVRVGRSEELPYADASFDRVLCQLVLRFVSDAPRAVAEQRRVGRPGGLVGACVWDSTSGMEMLDAFWQAARVVSSSATSDDLLLGGPGEIVALLEAAGLEDVVESELRVESTYTDFDELWDAFLLGVGPAGSLALGLDDERRERLRQELLLRIGSPVGSFTLRGMARCAVGRVH
ncbi:MAG: class I SAM-dependent methyltransferase [Thermoleophilia bacterium]